MPTGLVEFASAVVSAIVALAVALLAQRRHARTLRVERAESRGARANEQVEVITGAYEGVVEQLRDEINRLIDARRNERAAWEERERELTNQVNELRGTVETLQERLRAVEAELDRVEKRHGWWNQHDIESTPGTRRVDDSDEDKANEEGGGGERH